jgi:hypothetical protein
LPIDGLAIADCRLAIGDCRLPIGDWIADWRFGLLDPLATLSGRFTTRRPSPRVARA